MIEKPILFSVEMIKAIMDGRKTQTRRVLKLPSWSTGDWLDFELDHLGTPFAIAEASGHQCKIKSPYGKVGDFLWVRETWRTLQKYNDVRPSMIPAGEPVQYRADKIILGTIMGPFGKWRPSIFMPRWASRINLNILDVRVECLRDISAEDCFAEGAIPAVIPSPIDPISCFRKLWDSINAKRGYGWDTDPWVWVIEFEMAKE